MRFVKHSQLLMVVGWIVILLSAGCTPRPPESSLREGIIRHFESKKYTVLELTIGDITPIPLKDMRYMGMLGYIVDIKSLTLEVTENIGEPWNYSRGHLLIFKNGKIQVKESREKDTAWIIVTMSGIAVP